VSRSFISRLSSVVQSGITTLIWAGDADWICNWLGNVETVNAIEYAGSKKFENKEGRNYTVNGVVKGIFKSMGNLGWLRVFDAGHLVPYYRRLAYDFQIHSQTILMGK
jgi:carboxypeptidase C (cathepsin A)